MFMILLLTTPLNVNVESFHC